MCLKLLILNFPYVSLNYVFVICTSNRAKVVYKNVVLITEMYLTEAVFKKIDFLKFPVILYVIGMTKNNITLYVRRRCGATTEQKQQRREKYSTCGNTLGRLFLYRCWFIKLKNGCSHKKNTLKWFAIFYRDT